eukprot:1011732-Pelagomonas_calceolata.AAC.3
MAAWTGRILSKFGGRGWQRLAQRKAPRQPGPAQAGTLEAEVGSRGRRITARAHDACACACARARLRARMDSMSRAHYSEFADGYQGWTRVGQFHIECPTFPLASAEKWKKSRHVCLDQHLPVALCSNSVA